MRAWHKGLLGGLGAIMALVAIGFVLPSSKRVERSREIGAPPERVMALVSDLRRWPDWSPWVEQDPRITWRYSGPQQGVGSTQTWYGPKAGRGKITITKVTPRGIEYNLWFADNPIPAPGGVELEPVPQGTKITWHLTSQFGPNPLTRWFGVLIDPIVGPDFERGLKKLEKRVTDKE